MKKLSIQIAMLLVIAAATLYAVGPTIPPNPHCFDDCPCNMWNCGCGDY